MSADKRSQRAAEARLTLMRLSPENRALYLQMTRNKQRKQQEKAKLLSTSCPTVVDSTIKYAKDDMIRTNKLKNVDDAPATQSEKIKKILRRNEYSIIRSLLHAASLSEYPLELCNAIVTIFSVLEVKIIANYLLLDHLAKLPDKNQATLLRSDNSATCFFTSMLLKYGFSFLHSVVSPVLKFMKHNKKSYQINPEHFDEDADEIISKNAEVLKQLIERVLLNIQNGLSLIPKEIRTILKEVWDASEEQFPGYGCKMVGSVLFLRLLCPALISPEKYCLARKSCSPVAIRNLVLVSKILQNIMTGVEFDGSKESYMTCMNDLVKAHHNELEQNLTKLVFDRNYPEVPGKKLAPTQFSVLTAEACIKKYCVKYESSQLLDQNYTQLVVKTTYSNEL